MSLRDKLDQIDARNTKRLNANVQFSQSKAMAVSDEDKYDICDTKQHNVLANSSQ